MLCALLVVLAAHRRASPWRSCRRSCARSTTSSAPLPGYVDDLTSGRGPLGFLQRDYQIVDRVRERVEGGGSSALVTDVAGGAVQVAATVVSTVVAMALTILVMVVFLLLGGPRWVEAVQGVALRRAVATALERVWRPTCYRSVGGYVRGNLAISRSSPASRRRAVLLALGVPYALALALIVAHLRPRPRSSGRPSARRSSPSSPWSTP